MEDNIAISVQNLSKTYEIGKEKDETLRGSITKLFSFNKKNVDTFDALKNVSFEIPKGQVVGFIGKNGAGKSTILKLLSSITSPTNGKITISGRIASLLEVGTGFHPELTGKENIYLNATLLGMSRNEVKSKLDEIIEFSGVRKFLNTPVKHYSSGMYVRLAFAIAAHLDPEILVVDEVLAVGDLEFQKKCLGKMQDVASEGRTVLFVSHNMGILSQLCTRGIYLQQGTVKFDGKITDAISAYLEDQGQDQEFDVNIESIVRFNHLQMSNLNDELENVFDFDRVVKISGSVQIQEDQGRDLQICLAVLNKNKSRVCSFIKDVDGKASTFDFELSLPTETIAPGVYSILAQVYVPPGNEIFDEKSDVLPFEILDNGTKFQGYSNYGDVIFNNEIEIKKH